MIKDKAVPDDELMPDWERHYMYQVEAYLIHKYHPEMVEEFRISFARIRARKEQYLKHDEQIFQSTEELLFRIGNDLKFNAPFKPKKDTHKRTSPEHPGIGHIYQQQFEAL
jgi:hypothetical protein